MSEQVVDGTVIVTTRGDAWRVFRPGRWQIRRWLGWWARRAAAALLPKLGRDVPTWAQTGYVTIHVGGSDVSAMIVREPDALVVRVRDPNDSPWWVR